MILGEHSTICSWPTVPPLNLLFQADKWALVFFQQESLHFPITLIKEVPTTTQTCHLFDSVSFLLLATSFSSHYEIPLSISTSHHWQSLSLTPFLFPSLHPPPRPIPMVFNFFFSWMSLTLFLGSIWEATHHFWAQTIAIYFHNFPICLPSWTLHS